MYAGQDGTPIEDAQLDLTQLDLALVGSDSFQLTTKVVELRGDDPPGGSGLTFLIDLRTNTGDVVRARVDRSATTQTATASVGGVQADSVTVDTAAATVAFVAKSATLGEGVTSVAVVEAISGPTTPGVTAISDRASGTCVAQVVPGSTDGSQDDPGRGRSGRTPGEGNGKGNGNKPGGGDGGTDNAGFEPKSVTVAIIDTGVHAAHDEFDFDETVNAPNGQLVGWWDFSGANTTGATPDIWYEGHAPYDPDMSSSHGTGTSAMAVGLNRTPAKTPSACPGCNLAVAKTLNEGDIDDTGDDVIDGDIGAAILWATDVVGADVVSISIGSRIAGIVGYPGFLFDPDTYDAIAHARSQGALVVFSNGNGWANAGVPGEPGAISPYGNSPDALSVGASDIDGPLVTTDPDVAAMFTVTTGENEGGYHQISGTSFSAPFVAGGAARIIAEAKACRAPVPGPDDLEAIIKRTATDTEVPPMFEGYGVVDLATLGLAAQVACGAADLPEPAPETEAYMTNVVEPARAAWAHGDVPVGAPMTTTPVTGVTPAGVLGPSAPAGTGDAEIYEAVIAPGETLTVRVAYGDSALSPLEAPPVGPVQDFDIALYRASSTGTYNPSDLLVRGASGAGVDEEITYANASPAPMAVHLIVYGWSLVADQSFTMSGMAGPPLFDGYLGGSQHLF